MNEESKSSRRQFLKIGGAAIAMIPVVAMSGNALATVNAAMRTSMKYQDKPNGANHCANCMHFVRAKRPRRLAAAKSSPVTPRFLPMATVSPGLPSRNNRLFAHPA